MQYSEHVHNLICLISLMIARTRPAQIGLQVIASLNTFITSRKDGMW